MKNTINTLLKLINDNVRSEKSPEIYENTIKSLIIDFFTRRDNKEIPHLKSLNITDFGFKFNDDIVEVTITLTEAGLLVGKNGTTIKQLGGFLSKNLNKKVRIYVEESTIFKINQ
jgi:GTPase Era involved in 16S rRNA processing